MFHRKKKGSFNAEHFYQTIKITESQNKLKIVASDGTVSITSHTNGYIANLEKILFRSLP